MLDPARSRRGRDLAERAGVHVVHAYGDIPEFVLLGGLLLERHQEGCHDSQCEG
jgi:hypothetical protein